jgi:hypothetical protein
MQSPPRPFNVALLRVVPTPTQQRTRNDRATRDTSDNGARDLLAVGNETGHVAGWTLCPPTCRLSSEYTETVPRSMTKVSEC